MKFLGFLTILTINITIASFIGALKITGGQSEELKTQLVEIKNDEIVYQRRSKTVPYNIVLNYTVTQIDLSKPYEFTWMRDGEKLTIKSFRKSAAVANSKILYSTFTEKSTNELLVELHISDYVGKAGRYTLKVTQDSVSQSAFVDFTSAPILPTYNKPKRVLQGDTMRISCHVSAFPLPDKINWYFGPVESGSDSDVIAAAFKNAKPLVLVDGMELVNEQGVNDDTLKFSNLRYEDNGIYICRTKNRLGEDQTAVYLNVKDRWAALWPFIGVIIEVTVLVTAILLFERHQMRSKKPKGETKSSDNTNNVNSHAADKGPDLTTKITHEEETPLASQAPNHINEKESEDVRQRPKNV